MLKGSKVCSSCKNIKSIDDFNLRGKSRPGQRKSSCKECTKNNKKLWADKNKNHIKAYNHDKRILYNKRLLQYLTDKTCVDCGENDPIVLDFDHTHNKTCNVSFLIAGRWSWENILKEIEKCVIRCANCHRRKTAKERQTVKLKLIEESYAIKRI